jgi:hypothetical protein
MRTTTVVSGETLFHVAARTIGGSSFAGQGSLAAYVAAIVARNTQSREQPSPLAVVVDWTALAPGDQLELPS